MKFGWKAYVVNISCGFPSMRRPLAGRPRRAPHRRREPRIRPARVRKRARGGGKIMEERKALTRSRRTGSGSRAPRAASFRAISRSISKIEDTTGSRGLPSGAVKAARVTAGWAQPPSRRNRKASQTRPGVPGIPGQKIPDVHRGVFPGGRKVGVQEGFLGPEAVVDGRDVHLRGGVSSPGRSLCGAFPLDCVQGGREDAVPERLRNVILFNRGYVLRRPPPRTVCRLPPGN